MNKTLTTICAAALLLGGLIIQAGATITRQEFEEAAHALEKGAKDGKISKQAARAGVEGLRKAMGEDAKRDHKIAEGIGKHLKQVGERLKNAVANGDMTADEAWAKWFEVKKTKVAPRIKAAVKEGKMSEQDAKKIWHEIERAEVGEKLKAAVAAGEMSEEDARAKWEAYEKKHDR